MPLIINWRMNKMSYRSVVRNDAGEPIGTEIHYADSEMDRMYDEEYEEDSTYINCENKKNGQDCFENYYNDWDKNGSGSFPVWVYKHPFGKFGCDPCVEEAEIEGWLEF
jgi:hypothetical protein